MAVRTDATDGMLTEAFPIGALLADALPDASPTGARRLAARMPLAGSRSVGVACSNSVGSEALVCRLASARPASASPPVPLCPSCTAETELDSARRLRCLPPLSRTCRPEPAACMVKGGAIGDLGQVLAQGIGQVLAGTRGPV